MGGCENHDPLLAMGPLNARSARCRIAIRSQKRNHNIDNHPYIPLLRTIHLPDLSWFLWTQAQESRIPADVLSLRELE